LTGTGGSFILTGLCAGKPAHVRVSVLEHLTQTRRISRTPTAHRGAHLLLVLLFSALAVTGCGTRQDRDTAAIGPRDGLNHPMVGQRGPEFVAQDPGTESWLPLKGLHGKPIALLFFRPGAPFAAELAREFGRFRDDPTLAPVVFVALAQDTAERVRQFSQMHKVGLLRDPGSIARSYGIGEFPTIVLLDSEGVVRFRLEGYLGRQFRPRLEATVAALRRLPTMLEEAGQTQNLAYTEHPRAPLFSARDLAGRRVDLAELKGRVVVINFFDQECPHCLADLPELVPALKEFRGRGVAAIGIASREVGGGMRRFLKDHSIDYPVILDPSRVIFSKYESTRTPDTFLIDRDGFIRFREQGDRPDRGALTRLQLRILLGEDPVSLASSLPADSYAGDAACRACHAREYDDWLLTPHSIAWESLQKGDKWRDPECVPCHVTGQNKPGGFVDPKKTPHMVNVQCEVCHGPGGGHPAGTAIDPEGMRRACLGCHTGKFVLNFDLDQAMVLMAHQDHPDLDRLFHYSEAQRQRLEQINKRRLEKFKSGVAFVGAGACRDCHRREYEQWSRTPHAAAFAVLLREGRGSDRNCSPCHTTGTGMKGGFGDEPATGGPMTNVQCEVCHGPGDDHVKAPADLKKATIYGITDQCSFCIIQGVCATCHDQKNDPDFDIAAALPLVKHTKP
jgi:peroxiredoxin